MELGPSLDVNISEIVKQTSLNQIIPDIYIFFLSERCCKSWPTSVLKRPVHRGKLNISLESLNLERFALHFFIPSKAPEPLANTWCWS